MVHNSTTTQNDIREFTQQDGRGKKTAKHLCVTNVTGLLRACFVVMWFCLKENEVWRKVVSNKIIVTLVTQGLLSSFLSRTVALVHYYHTRLIREICIVPMEFSSTLVF